MKVLVIGSAGSTGQRYCAILRFLHHIVEEYDINDSTFRLPKADAVIIASPTECHYVHIIQALSQGGPVLCEKPLVKSLDELFMLQDARHIDRLAMVCNWAYLPWPTVLKPESHHITYNYYNPGPRKYKIYQNMAQALLLDKGRPILNLESPILNLSVDGRPYTCRDIEMSYVRMLDEWLKGTQLWGVKEAETMLRKMRDYDLLHTSAEHFYTPAK